MVGAGGRALRRAAEESIPLLLHAAYLVMLPLCVGLLGAARVASPWLVLVVALLEAWAAMNLVRLAAGWRALRRAGWAEDLCERCLLTGIPVDGWVIAHREELMVTPLHERGRLEYDNYAAMVRARGAWGPWAWHAFPVAVVVPAVVALLVVSVS